MSEKLVTLIENFKIPIALSLVGIVLIVGGIFASNLSSNKAKSQTEQFPKESLVNSRQISVDVSGAVKNPGVYKLDEGARIEQAIKIAGGFSEKANQEFISKILNLAQKLVDGSKVYIPQEGESTTQVSSAASGVAGVNAQAKININTATQSELENLPGIGPVTASKIISDRPYQAIEELVNKKVISKSVFEKIKDSLSLY